MKSLFRKLTFTVSLAAMVGSPVLTVPQLAAAAPAAKADAPKAGAKQADAKDAKAGAKAEPAKEQERTGPADFSSGKPVLEESKRTAEADRKRDEAIEQLKKIIPNIAPGNQKSELLFQLAELWIEKSKYFYFQEYDELDKKKAAFYECQNEKGLNGCGDEPKLNNHQSELYRDQALQLYEQILKDSPTYPRKDEVLFALAVNLYEKGDTNGSIAKHRDLVTQYPNSGFVGDSYVAMGEHFFKANDLGKAEQAYLKALEASSLEPRVYNFALYKLAWCAYNGGAYDDALKKFQEVVVRAESSKVKNEVALKGEALNDMILTWQKLEAVELANNYYKSRTSNDNARRYFTKLANRYFESGDNQLAISSYRLLLSEAPNDPKSPEFQSNIVRSYEGLRQRDKVLSEMEVLVDNYKPGSAWSVANKTNQAALNNAYELAEGAMRELVTNYHQEAQKTKEVKTYRLASAIYKKYLDSFSDSDHSYNLRYYYAEILWTLEEWETAAEQYELTYAKDPKGSYSKTAAYNALLAYEKLIAIDKGELAKSQLRDDQKVDEKKGKGTAKQTKKISASTISKDVKEETIPKWEKKMIEACDRYAGIAAEDKRLEKDEINVRYKAAFIFYDRKHFTEAANRFGDIILKWPTDAQAQKAADLSLNILEVKEEWFDLARLSRAFYDNKKLAAPGSAWSKDLAKIMEGAQYKYIDLVVYKEEKQPAKAAVMFRDFVKDFPQSQYAAQALRYAMIIFEEAKELDKGIEVGEQLLTQYKTTEHYSPAMLTLAGFYERTANFGKAATYYERYAREWEQKVGIRPPENAPKNWKAKDVADVIKANKDDAKRASDSLYNAALWTEGLGDFEKAISLYREYIAKYKSVPDGVPVATLAFNIALIREKEQAWTKAEAAFDEFIKSYEKQASAGEIFFARYKRARALQQLKKNDEAMKLFEVCAKEFPKVSEKDKKNIDYIDAYAHARFMLLEPMWKGYLAVKFDNVRTLKKALGDKVKLTPQVEKAYADVLAIGSADWGIAALTRIGTMYQDFSRNFLDSPDPVGLDDEQLMMYRSELENRAFPLEEKAIEAYEKALAKSYELNVYNEYTLNAQNALNRFKPGEYGEIQAVSFTGSEFFSVSPAAQTIDARFGSSLEAVVKKAEAEKAEAKAAADAKATKAEETPAEKQDQAPEKKKGTLIMDKAAAK